MNKLLTLVIPTYNMEKYLRRCLDSLIVPDEQMQLLEVLIINDGSKDSSSKIAHEYQDKYPDAFKVIDKENGNYGSCINRGLKEASGEYVKVLDSDDYFNTPSLIKLLNYLNSCSSDLVLTDFVEECNGEKIKRYCIKDEIFDIKSESICDIDSLINGNYSFVGRMHNFTYNIRVFKDLNYTQIEGISYTDQQWIVEPFTKVKTFSYLPVDLYYYQVGRDGQTMEYSQMMRHLNDLVLVCKRLVEIYKDVTPKYERYIYNILERQLYFIYKPYICWSVKSKDFVSLESNLIQNNKLTSLTDSYKYKGLPFVKKWRKTEYKRTYYVLIFIRHLRSLLK